MSVPIKPNKDILELLISLEHNGAFIKFLNFLKTEADNMGNDFSLIPPGPELHQFQGQSFELHEILHLFKDRHKLLSALTAVHENKGRTIL